MKVICFPLYLNLNDIISLYECMCAWVNEPCSESLLELVLYKYQFNVRYMWGCFFSPCFIFSSMHLGHRMIYRLNDLPQSPGRNY